MVTKTKMIHDFTQTELHAIYENNENLFLRLLEDWWANDGCAITKDNYEELRDKYIDLAKPDSFTDEKSVFGKLQEASNNPTFHNDYFCLYTDVDYKMFCPSYPDKCCGCEQNSREYMSFIEVIYRKSDGRRVEASYHYNINGREKTISLSTCCLAEKLDKPSGFYCTYCGEEN